MIKKILKIFCVVWIVLGGFFAAYGARAATLGLIANNATPEIGQPIRIDIPLDMQGEDANAIQAQILFPPGQFILQGINDGASPVSFWINPPTETVSGTVSFSGIMPGGFQDAASSVVSLWLLPTASGTVEISLGNIQLLRDDGQGTPIPVATNTLSIDVSGTIASATQSRPISFASPEPFVPVVSRDPNIFGGQYFLVFSTTDKGSGIDHYQVLEAPPGGAAGAWQTATSPYLLHDQSLESNIYVRAVDHAGNFIIVEVMAAHPAGEQARRSQDEILIVLLCVLLIIIILFARKWKKV